MNALLLIFQTASEEISLLGAGGEADQIAELLLEFRALHHAEPQREHGC
jgi:hypothetical protein